MSCSRLARVTAVALAVSLGGVALSACGARVAPYLGAGAGIGQGNLAAGTVRPVSSGSSGANGANGTSVSNAVVNPGQGAASSSAGSNSPGVSTAPTSGGNVRTTGSTPPPSALSLANFSYDPATQAAYCPNANGNTASAPGVTPSSIVFGNVSGLTGALTGTFGAGYEAVQAAFDGVNAAGGICGRKLELLVENDNQDASTNAADVANLIAHPVFAFAGSLSDADNGGVQEMQQANVPDIGFAINTNRSLSPDYWSAGGGSGLYVRNGIAYAPNTIMAAQKQFGQFPTRMAFLSYNISISASAAQMYATLYKESGASICYTDYSISVATASLQGDVIQMESNHCNGVYTTMDVVGNSKMLQAMQQQNWYPPFFASTFDTYTPAQITEAGQSAAQGFQTSLPALPLNSSNPLVRLYISELARYEPGKQPSEFGFQDFVNAEMLFYALVKSGHAPTRQSIVNVFESIHNWTAWGAISPGTPSERPPNPPGTSPPWFGLTPSCYVEMKVQGNQFVRDWPAHGLYCGGAMLPVGPASNYGE